MCPSLCPYLKESRKAGIKGTKEPLLRWSNASLLLLCSTNLLHNWTMTWVSDMSTDAENVLSLLMSCRDHNHPCRRIFTSTFHLKMRWAYKYFPRETEMSRHHKVVKRPSSATFSKELITSERIQWLFTHQGIVRCSAGCCQRSGEGEFPIAPQEKIRQHVKTIRGCVMTGSADNSLSTRILFQWRSLWPDEADWQADTCPVLTCPHMQQLTSSLYGQKNVQVFAVDT